MGFEPQKFFVGLIDLFAILLPGALLAFMLKDDLAAIVPAAVGLFLSQADQALNQALWAVEERRAALIAAPRR